MRILALILSLIALAAPAQACGPETRCEVEGGYYLAAPPPDWDGRSPLPLIVYFHGWNGSPRRSRPGHCATCARARSTTKGFITPR